MLLIIRSLPAPYASDSSTTLRERERERSMDVHRVLKCPPPLFTTFQCWMIFFFFFSLIYFLHMYCKAWSKPIRAAFPKSIVIIEAIGANGLNQWFSPFMTCHKYTGLSLTLCHRLKASSHYRTFGWIFLLQTDFQSLWKKKNPDRGQIGAHCRCSDVR